MNIALIGNGGREHDLCKKLKESRKINNIFAFLAMLEPKKWL